MILGSEGATAIAPIDCVGCESKIGFQVRPSSSVFPTPPLTTPDKKVCGLPGTPVIARVRPPRNGPTNRHCRSWVTTAVEVCARDSPEAQIVSRTAHSIEYKRISTTIDSFSFLPLEPACMIVHVLLFLTGGS